MTMTHETREGWLNAAVELIRPAFAAIGASLPPTIFVSMGFPRGERKGSKVGQCWPAAASGDNESAHIFIHPNQTDAARIIDILVHELCHAADDCQNDHKKPFIKLARAMGLTGKWTATVASPELLKRITEEWLPELGPLPHPGLGEVMAEEKEKKQTTRMIKVVCPADDYNLRTTRKWIKIGLPTCPCGTLMTTPDYDPDQDDDEGEDDD